MSIKVRKVPKHLVIHDNYDNRKGRFSFMKVLFAGAGVLLLTYAMTVTTWANSFFFQY